MKRIKIASIVALTLVFAVGEVQAQDHRAVLSAVTGKVEIQNPGEQSWHPASAGMEVAIRATISTGFGGRAILRIGDSTLTVAPLTRLRIDELSMGNNVALTRLAMPVGRIRVEVKSIAGIKNDFSVKSPLATAAVRGTGFDTDGELIRVFEHIVVFYSQSGIGRKVGEGESALSTDGGSPSGGADRREADTTVNPYTSLTGVGGLGGGLPGLGYGNITVSWHNP
ncbi:MAG: FecR domain-containing protein [Rectinemataceae bacterium]